MTSLKQPPYLETAREIGNTMLRNAIWHHDRKCNWTGYWIEPVNGDFKPCVRSFGPDLYAGTSGIALFLAGLYSEEPDPLLLHTVQGAVQHALDTMDTAPDHGFYCGKPGIAASLISIGRLLERPDWIRAGIDLLSTINVLTSGPHETDLISGIAGSIPLLLDVHALYPDDTLLQKAVQMGQLLCDSATKNGPQWSWATVPAARHLTGFSHGAAGISAALLRLYSTTGNNDFRTAAQYGLNYEQRHFDQSQQNWPDFREANGNQFPCSHAWCHGAPGIALSRMAAAADLADLQYQQQASTALRTTAANMDTILREHYHASNYSLCHGLAGNADVLLYSGQPEYVQMAQTVGIAGILNYAKPRMPWPSGLNYNQYQTPGLMMGLSGTGYFYLRLHNPHKFRTVLLPQLFA